MTQSLVDSKINIHSKRQRQTLSDIALNERLLAVWDDNYFA